jgi:hypothetical protein
VKGKEKSMAEIRNIIQRFREGQSNRRIHKDLNTHRTIIQELRALAIAHQWLHPELPMPSDEAIAIARAKNKDAVPQHVLDPYKKQIEQWHNQGHSSIVIQKLLSDKKCFCDVQVIRRYRRKHFPKSIEPVMVRSTISGRDLELDFGELGRFLDDHGVMKRVWLFSLRLRHSRKAYREIVTDQKINTFLMGHVHAFEYFNGVPCYCILDNLKAGVIKSTIDNDQINRSYQELAEHYRFIISPCLPRTPNHKGGVEGDIKYAKRNFLPYFLEKQKEMGIHTPTIHDLKEALDAWTKEVDDVHIIHGVGRSPEEIFNLEEKHILRSLPKDRWEPTSWCQCKVRRDWRVILDNAYYSVPYQFIGKTVQVCVTRALVRIFYENKEIALHEKAKTKWDYKKKAEHAPQAEEAVLQCSREGLLLLAEKIGPSTHQLAEAILAHPTNDKLRPVRHLLRLAEKYSKGRLEQACHRALGCKLFSYASVKNILEKNLELNPIDSAHKSKVIPLENYRFRRDPKAYKSSEYFEKETFDEKMMRIHPFSKHGNGMMKPFEGQLADQIIEEHMKKKQFYRS